MPSLRWTKIVFDTDRNEFYIDRTHSGATVAADFPAKRSPRSPKTGQFDLDLIVDRSSIEVFARRPEMIKSRFFQIALIALGQADISQNCSRSGTNDEPLALLKSVGSG
jgi:sucrose-6-phosphate hydrolase SacC (GH32 family)